MISNFVSFKTILARLYRYLDINTEINESDVIEWVSDALLMIGSYSQYNEISDCIELQNGKAKLPCNFFKIVDISYQGWPVSWATNTMAHNYQCDGCKIPQCCTEYTFYINDGYIITNITPNDTNSPQTTKLCIVYLGVPVDEEGYPMVPDDIYFYKAIESYVAYMLDYRDWRKGKIADKVYQKSEKDWLFYVNSARGSANQPNTAQLERLKNIWQRLIPNPNQYNKHFTNLGRDQGRRLH